MGRSWAAGERLVMSTLARESAAGSGDAYRLFFLLPGTILVPSGRHCPCLHGCVLTVSQNGHVSIEGPSREQVIEQAKRFLRINAQHHPPTDIAATLVTPADRPGRPPGRDHYTIIINTAVAIIPGGMGAERPLVTGMSRFVTVSQ